MKIFVPTLFAFLASWAGSTPQDPAEEKQVVVYDVKEFAVAPASPVTPANLDAEAPAPTLDDLCLVLRERMQPPLEDVKLVVVDKTVATFLSAEQRSWTESFLDHQRSLGGTLYDVSARVLRMDRATQAALGLGAEAGTLSEKELVSVLHRASQADGGIEMLEASRILTHAWSRASTRTGEDVLYVGDWTVHEAVEPGPKRLVVPIVKKAWDGMQITVLATSFEDRTVYLDLQLEQVVLKRPLPVFETNGLEICLPEWSVRRLSTRTLLGDGQAAYFSGAEASEEGKVLVCLVRAKLVEPEKVERKGGKKGERRRR